MKHQLHAALISDITIETTFEMADPDVAVHLQLH